LTRQGGGPGATLSGPDPLLRTDELRRISLLETV
jgi:hypothetical protein